MTTATVTPILRTPQKRFQVRETGTWGTVVALGVDHRLTLAIGDPDLRLEHATYRPDELVSGCMCPVHPGTAEVAHTDWCMRRPWACPRCDCQDGIGISVTRKSHAPIDPKWDVVTLTEPLRVGLLDEDPPELCCDGCNYTYPVPDGLKIRGL